MKQLICLALLFYGLHPRVTARPRLNKPDSIHPLALGEQVPDITLQMLLPSGCAPVRLSDFRGKLLLLDCWNIYCGTCVANMPHLYELQQQFSDKMVVLPVAFGFSQQVVQQFLDKRKGLGKPIRLPTAVVENYRDNDLHRLFPVLSFGFPVELFIDSNGKLIAITGSEQITTANILRLLTGSIVTLSERKFQSDFDANRLLLVNGNGGNGSEFLYRSMITAFNDSIAGGPGVLKQHNGHFLRLFVNNASLSLLAQVAFYGRADADPYNKLLITETGDRSSYLASNLSPGDDRKKHLYCYELVLPASARIAEALAIMRTDLCRFFGVQITLQRRKTTCLVLTLLTGRNGKGLFTSGQSMQYENDWGKDSVEYRIRNRPFNEFPGLFNLPEYPVVVDETRLTTNFDISISLPQHYNYATLQRKLAAFGIGIKEEKRLMQVLVIQKENSLAK